MITITNQAKEHIQSIIKKNNKIAFRLSITKTGCSGLAYLPSVENNPKESDQVINLDDLIIYLDTKYLDILNTTEIDYVEKQLGQKQLVYSNANEGARCGCGESFTLGKNDE